MITIKAKIAAPDGVEENRREILIGNRSEYDKLPLDKYPITHTNRPEGVGIKLKSEELECEASLHRYKKGMV